jgi:ATP synthase protein I
MDEYYKLKKSILLVTLPITGTIFFVVWFSFSLSTALSYLLGACVGIVYLRMLAKDVEKLSSDNGRISSGRLAIFAGMIVLATQLDQLSVFPVFLGFLTYKIAIIGYVLATSLVPTQSQ